jgi:hypothetical protein
MPDRASVARWVEGYVRAWSSNDPDDIGDLFTPEATYRTTPHAEPWRGRGAIVAGWLDRRDEPGQATFEWDLLAIDGETVIITGETDYREPPIRYSNLWVLRLDAEGHCSEFTEWWMQQNLEA